MGAQGPEFERIVSAIVTHVRSNGGAFGNWYVGIANDFRQRLFVDHNVAEKGGYWVYDTASSDTVARGIEKHLINQYGMQGGPGGGDATTRIVYAYLITGTTKE